MLEIRRIRVGPREIFFFSVLQDILRPPSPKKGGRAGTVISGRRRRRRRRRRKEEESEGVGSVCPLVTVERVLLLQNVFSYCRSVCPLEGFLWWKVLFGIEQPLFVDCSC